MLIPLGCTVRPPAISRIGVIGVVQTSALVVRPWIGAPAFGPGVRTAAFDATRPRAQPRPTSVREPEPTEAPPHGRDRVVFESLRAPGPVLAFQAQLYAQSNGRAATPADVAASAYQVTAASSTGFLGLLDPLDLSV